MEFKTKPCGTDWCPLVDEFRLWAEDIETMGLDYDEQRKLVPVTLKVWCHGRRAKRLPSDPMHCKEVLSAVAEQVSYKRPFYPPYTAALRWHLGQDELRLKRGRLEEGVFSTAPF